MAQGTQLTGSVGAGGRNKPIDVADVEYLLHSAGQTLTCKQRARIEQAIGKLKRCKRVAMRCERTDISYPGIIDFATA